MNEEPDQTGFSKRGVSSRWYCFNSGEFRYERRTGSNGFFRDVETCRGGGLFGTPGEFPPRQGSRIKRVFGQPCLVPLNQPIFFLFAPFAIVRQE